MKKQLPFLLLFLLAASLASAEIYQYKNKEGITSFTDKPPHHDSRRPMNVTVKFIFDGDTFLSTTGIKFRLLGIDTPETAKKNNPGDYFGEEAKEALTKLIAGKEVSLQYDVEEKDDYERFLVFATTEEGVPINEYLVKEGFARTFFIPPNLLKADEFKQLEVDARSQQKGLWQNPEEGEVITSEEVWKYQGKIKFVQGVVTQINEEKRGTELVFDDGKFVAYIYRQNLRYFSPVNEYLGRKLTVKGKVNRKVKHSTTVLFHPLQFW